METATVETWAADAAVKLFVIERLRKSRCEEGELSRRAGACDGKIWAIKHAEHSELLRLAGLDLDDFFNFDPEQQNATVCEIFAMEITAGSADKMFGDNHDTYDMEYVRGFAEGALEVWDSVKDEL